MGDPKKGRKKYSKPRKAFQKERIVKGKEIKDLYGLKNNREFLKAESTETRHISRNAMGMSLSRHDIGFSFTSNNKSIFSSRHSRLRR